MRESKRENNYCY